MNRKKTNKYLKHLRYKTTRVPYTKYDDNYTVRKMCVLLNLRRDSYVDRNRFSNYFQTSMLTKQFPRSC